MRRLLAAQTIPFPARFRVAAIVGRAFSFLRPLLPRALRPMLDLIPATLPPAESWGEVTPAIGPRRARVALLTGCAQQVLAPDINTATIAVLTQQGVEVVVPREQGCCGGLAWHTGDRKAAQAFARRNLAAFPTEVDAILTNAAGCGSAMHEYHLILSGTTDEASAEAFRHRVQDVSLFLAKLGWRQPTDSPQKKLRVAYHDACHLAHAQGVRSQPREVLTSIPGVELREIPDAAICCGSAGVYNLINPEPAAELGRLKAANVRSVAPDALAAANPGCLLQISANLGAEGEPIPTFHPIELIDASLRGEDAAGLLARRRALLKSAGSPT